MYTHSTNVEDNRNAPENNRFREQLVWSGRHVPHRGNGSQRMGNPTMSAIAHPKQTASARMQCQGCIAVYWFKRFEIELYQPVHCEPRCLRHIKWSAYPNID